MADCLQEKFGREKRERKDILNELKEFIYRPRYDAG